MPLLTLTLHRLVQNEEGTFGLLVNDDTSELICCTAELPWRNNARRISCIPAGTYTVDPNDVSTNFGKDWLHVEGVPDRDRIGIHKGNWPRQDSRGCILVGLGFFDSDKGQAVSNSGKALDKLLDYSYGDHFNLAITRI